MANAVEGKQATRNVKKKLVDNHRIFIKSLMDYHSGEVTLKLIREALLAAFEDISLSSLSTLMRRDLRYSNRRASVRNARVINDDRPSQIRIFAFTLLKALENEIDILNVDECAIVFSEAAQTFWAPIGTKLITIDKSKYCKRYTLLLGVTAAGKFFARMIDGSCTACIYRKYIDYVSQKLITGASCCLTVTCPILPVRFKTPQPINSPFNAFT